MDSSNYHPMWYQQNRPYAKFSKQIFLSHGLSGESLHEIQNRITRDWNNELNLKKINSNEVVTDFMKEVSLAFYFGAFAGHGYNIFSFTEKLGEMLENTSAKDIPIDALKSPYPVYFVQFHRPVQWGKLQITGAYVIDEESVPALQVCLVIAPTNLNGHWMSAPSGYFYLPLSRSSKGGLGELIDSAINSEITNKWKHATGSMPIETTNVSDLRDIRAKRESMDLSSGREAIHNAMNYLANCLCYLSSHEPSNIGYASDAPEKLIEKSTLAKTSKQKNKAQSQLKSMGHFPITYLQVNSSKSGSMISGEQTFDNKKRQHWRRGHWRNQRKGEGLSESCLIWIKPTLVGEEKMPEQAREYRLS